MLSAPNVVTNSPNRYLTILDAAWQEHLRPCSPDAPTVISTFAGCGGSSLGYSMAGYRELLAVEWDNNAVETFKSNFPDIPVYHGDIAELSVEQCLDVAGIRPGELDVFDGSPPCQGFSTAGKRMIDDPRNQLFREYVRLLRGLRPKVFVMENVSGMVKGKMKLIFAEIMKELKASGYKVSARLMNTMYFNVPQSRQRMIFIGVRDDLGVEPSHPKAETRPIMIREAWDSVMHEEAPYLSPRLRSFISRIPMGGEGPDAFPGEKRRYFSTKRFHWNKPSNSLTKDNIGSRACFVHPSEDRAITLAEAKRCHSYPDEFRFIGGYGKGMNRIGNSVPPLFMRSIALHIKQEILRPN